MLFQSCADLFDSSLMMSISFPTGGSLNYAHDLEKMAERAAIPL
jgi:hypothetical protein